MSQKTSFLQFRVSLCVCLSVSMICCAAEGSSLPATIGHLDSEDALVFEGNTSYSKEQICKALYRDKDVILAISPEAPFEDYLRVLQSRIRLGYLNDGFYSPHVEVAYVNQPEQIRIMIDEGPRYTKGALVIDGTSDALKETLTQCLWGMDSRVADASGISEVMESIRKGDLNAALTKDVYMALLWGSSKSPSFAPSFIKTSTQYFDNLLKVLGYYNCQYTMELLPDHTNRTASLHITFQDEGIRAQIGAIHIDGNTINTDQQVQDYLGIQTGQPLDDILIRNLQQKLYASGRFRFMEVAPVINTDDPLHSTVNITLKETPSATPLGQKLNEKEALMQKVGQFIEGYQSWEKDICFRMDFTQVEGMVEFLKGFGIVTPAVDVIYSSQKGVILREVVDGTRTLNTVVLTPEYVWYLCPPLDLDVRVTDVKGEAIVQFTLTPNPANENGWSIAAGMGVQSSNTDKTFTYQPEINFHPAFWFYLANDPENEVTFVSDTRSLVKCKGVEIDVDRQSGEIIGLRTKGKVPVAFRQGAFDQYIQKLETSSNLYDTATAIPSGLGIFNVALPLYLTHLPADRFTIDQKKEVGDAWRQIFSEFAECDIRDNKTQTSRQKSFPLPIEEQLASGGMLPLFLGMIYQSCHDNLPRDSWVRTLSHAGVLMTSGYAQHPSVAQELQQLYASDQIGPIGYYFIAQCLRRVGHPASNAFAQRGLQTLSGEDFRKDWKPLLTKESKVKNTFCCCLEKFQTIPDNEIQTAASVFPDKIAVLLRALAQQLKQTEIDRIDEALDPILTNFWEKDGSAQMRKKLSEFLTPPNTTASISVDAP